MKMCSGYFPPTGKLILSFIHCCILKPLIRAWHIVGARLVFVERRETCGSDCIMEGDTSESYMVPWSLLLVRPPGPAVSGKYTEVIKEKAMGISALCGL